MIKQMITFSMVLLISVAGTCQELSDVFSTKNSYGEKKLKKAPKKVYIANFKVLFHVIASATASSTGGRQVGGGSYKGNTSTTMTVAVDGVDVPDFQQITDQVYQQFVTDLQAHGYELIQTEEASKINFYEDWEIKQGGQVNYANVPGYVSVTPTGTQYLVKKETKKGREKGTFLDRTPKISKELDDAIIVDASFAFPFIEMKTKSSNMIGFSAVKAKTDFEMGTAVGSDGLTALYEPTQMKFVSGNSAGAAAEVNFIANLKKPMKLPGVFKDEKFKEFSAATSTPAYYGIVFVEDKTDKVTNIATCDQASYVQTSTSIIEQFIAMTMAEFYENAQVQP